MSINRTFTEFIDSAVSVYHTQELIAATLRDNGAIKLAEGDSWRLQKGQLYYVARNQSSIIAFRTGTDAPAEAGFKIAGAHTDSPGLKLKLHGGLFDDNRQSDTLPVEIYGSPLLYTWMDRTLSLAGRVVVHSDKTPNALQSYLIHLPDAGLIVPSLAIHLNRDANKSFSLNPHEHMQAVSGVKSECLMDYILANANIQLDNPKHSLEADIFLYDSQPAALGGLDASFVHSGRIDNIAGCYTNLDAFLQADTNYHTQVLACFDAEEIGSRTYGGANSGFLTSILQRICFQDNPHIEQWYRAASRSLCISNDGAHAVHPNYADKHDKRYRPVINNGPVIKLSASQRYASTAWTAQYIKNLCARAKSTYQFLINRADIPAGSTIGPFTHTQTQIPTVDIGIPMLAMHSIRETAGLQDIENLTQIIRCFYSSDGSLGQ